MAGTTPSIMPSRCILVVLCTTDEVKSDVPMLFQELDVQRNVAQKISESILSDDRPSIGVRPMREAQELFRKFDE